MAEVAIPVADAAQLTAVADLLLRQGQVGQAARLYRAVLKVAPNAPHIHTRLGLALSPNPRTLFLLDLVHEVERGNELPYVSDGLLTWKKTLPFLEDARFKAISEKHAQLLPIANWEWQLQTVLWAVQQTQGLDGDLVELGVFRGHTTSFVADYVNFASWPKTWWLYDTFTGIPEDQMDEGWKSGNARSYSPQTFTVDEVRERFSSYPNIRVIEGRVPEILSDTAPDKISFLHMDMNNATAEISALDRLFDRLVPGGVIVFDDYLWTVAAAQYQAEKAWFAARGLVILPSPTGQGVFVKPTR